MTFVFFLAMYNNVHSIVSFSLENQNVSLAIRKFHLPDLVSRAKHHLDSRPQLAGEQPEDDGTHVLSAPLRLDFDNI